MYLKKRTVEVDYDHQPDCSGFQVRKNLAVHVSLSSIFTLSKSRPLGPFGLASLEAGLPNFWEQDGSSGYPAAPLPFPEVAFEPGRQGLRRQRWRVI